STLPPHLDWFGCRFRDPDRVIYRNFLSSLPRPLAAVRSYRYRWSEHPIDLLNDVGPCLVEKPSVVLPIHLASLARVGLRLQLVQPDLGQIPVFSAGFPQAHAEVRILVVALNIPARQPADSVKQISVHHQAGRRYRGNLPRHVRSGQFTVEAFEVVLVRPRAGLGRSLEVETVVLMRVVLRSQYRANRS